VSPFIIALVAVSAVLHVSWNVRLKTAGDPVRAATVGLLAALAVIVPLGVVVQGFFLGMVANLFPFAPGGGTDVYGRMLAEELHDKLKQTVVVENRPGASMQIGTTAVAKSAPDGSMLLMASATSLAVNPNIYKSLAYDPIKDLAPIGLVGSAYFVLVANPALGVKTLPELIAYIKARPGQLSYASAGIGTPHHIFMELFMTMAGLKMQHVPYKGSVPALNDVLAGHIELMFCDVPPSAGMIQTGKVRALGVTTKARLAAFPDIPPINESVPGFEVAGWFMVVAPAKTPPAVVAKLHTEMKNVLDTPAIKEQIAKLSLLPVTSPSVDDMKAFVKSEIVRWGKVVEAAGIAGTE